MKKIAIIIDSLGVGGIEKFCLELIRRLQPRFEIALFLGKYNIQFMKEIPKGIDIEIIKQPNFRTCLLTDLKKILLLKAFLFFIKYIFYAKILKRWVVANKLLYKERGVVVDEQFDCSIAFHGMKISDLCKTVYSLESKIKIAWIHGEHPFTGKSKDDVSLVYNSFHCIYCVSQLCKKNFLLDFPNLDSYTHIFHPLLNREEIKMLSEKTSFIPFSDGTLSILTVGRLSLEKGQDLIIETVPLLRSCGIPFKWYLIGGGDEFERLYKEVCSRGLNEIIFLGPIKNPYPYMRRCDIYVQPSYSDAYSISVMEAALLGKPLVITNVVGAIESLNPNIDCMVCEPNAYSLSVTIKELMIDNDKRSLLSKNIVRNIIDNSNDLQMLMETLNE